MFAGLREHRPQASALRLAATRVSPHVHLPSQHRAPKSSRATTLARWNVRSPSPEAHCSKCFAGRGAHAAASIDEQHQSAPELCSCRLRALRRLQSLCMRAAGWAAEESGACCTPSSRVKVNPRCAVRNGTSRYRQASRSYAPPLVKPRTIHALAATRPVSPRAWGSKAACAEPRASASQWLAALALALRRCWRWRCSCRAPRASARLPGRVSTLA